MATYQQLQQNYAAIVELKACRGRAFAKTEFRNAVIKTQSDYGALPRVSTLIKQFEAMVEQEPSWGKNIIKRELSTILCELPSC